MIDLLLPNSITLTEECLSRGIVITYLNGKPHGMVNKCEGIYSYFTCSDTTEYDLSEDSFSGLISFILHCYPEISFKMLETNNHE
jgi:hypothetical protein